MINDVPGLSAAGEHRGQRVGGRRVKWRDSGSLTCRKKTLKILTLWWPKVNWGRWTERYCACFFQRVLERVVKIPGYKPKMDVPGFCHNIFVINNEKFTNSPALFTISTVLAAVLLFCLRSLLKYHIETQWLDSLSQTNLILPTKSSNCIMK